MHNKRDTTQFVGNLIISYHPETYSRVSELAVDIYTVAYNTLSCYHC